jgi:DeoR family transcriptional regulator, glycerol-3-phosphate regulon repressor
MPAETRQERILDVVRRRGYAGIDELVSRFDVTPQTIRRDLQELSARGLLRRHHGGASIPSSTVNTDYAQRHVEQAAEKERIAAAAASLVTSGSSLFMTPGTTVEAVAAAIARSDLTNLRVVTNSTVAAEILGKNRNIIICVTGGLWQAHNHALAGQAAVEMVERYRCDIMLTSIGAIDPDGWLLEFRDEEATVAKAMLANARRRILVADHSKFAKVAACKLAPISEMTTLVTDQPPSKSFCRLMKDGRCELVVASRAPERHIGLKG